MASPVTMLAMRIRPLKPKPAQTISPRPKGSASQPHAAPSLPFGGFSTAAAVAELLVESAQPTSTQDEEPSSVGAPAPSATSPDVTTHMPSESVIHETSYSVASAGATGDVKAALDALRGQYDSICHAYRAQVLSLHQQEVVAIKQAGVDRDSKLASVFEKAKHVVGGGLDIHYAPTQRILTEFFQDCVEPNVITDQKFLAARGFIDDHGGPKQQSSKASETEIQNDNSNEEDSATATRSMAGILEQWRKTYVSITSESRKRAWHAYTERGRTENDEVLKHEQLGRWLARKKSLERLALDTVAECDANGISEAVYLAEMDKPRWRIWIEESERLDSELLQKAEKEWRGRRAAQFDGRDDADMERSFVSEAKMARDSDIEVSRFSLDDFYTGGSGGRSQQQASGSCLLHSPKARIMFSMKELHWRGRECYVAWELAECMGLAVEVADAKHKVREVWHERIKENRVRRLMKVGGDAEDETVDHTGLDEEGRK